MLKAAAPVGELDAGAQQLVGLGSMTPSELIRTKMSATCSYVVDPARVQVGLVRSDPGMNSGSRSMATSVTSNDASAGRKAMRIRFHLEVLRHDALASEDRVQRGQPLSPRRRSGAGGPVRSRRCRPDGYRPPRPLPRASDRYTVSPAAKEELLDRLLALNHERYAAEVAAGLHDKKRIKARRPPKGSAGQGTLV